MLLGHSVCVSQWIAFILVYHQSLGRGKKVRFPCLWASLMAVGMLVISIRFQMGFFNVAAVAINVIYLVAAVQLFGGTAAEKTVACLTNGTMCLLTENTVCYACAWVKGICPSQIWRYKSCLVIVVLANLVVGVLVAWSVARWNRRRALDPLQGLVMNFFPGVAVVLNTAIMLTGNNTVPSLPDMMLTVGLTAAVLVHLLIVEMFNDQVVQGQASQFQAALEQQRAEALMDSYTAQRRLTHEFTNHITALEALLQQQDLAGAREYLASVNKAVTTGTTILDTHNPLLDSILSKKYEEAARQGVAVYFDLCELKELPFRSTDMVIVLSNLMDNAIRAAAQAEPPEVYVRTRKTGDEYLLSVRNRVRQDLELEEGGLPRSTKKEPGHGMGLANVREVLDRYHAEFTISCRDRWFRFTCAVPTDGS